MVSNLTTFAAFKFPVVQQIFHYTFTIMLTNR